MGDADHHGMPFHRLGADVDDAGGTGPGSYDVRGNVWHLDCCSPEDGRGWMVFAAIFGWSNNGSLGWSRSIAPPRSGPLNGFGVLGTILGYIFYWIAVIVTLFVLKRRGTSPVLI